MVVSCAAFGCTNRADKSAKEKKLTWHSFPLKHPDLLSRWISALKREHFSPSRYSFLCSEHFAPECFYTRGFEGSKTRLRPNSVPTVFNFPKHIKPKIIKPRKAPRSRNSADEKDEHEEQSAGSSNPAERISHDHSYIISPRSSKRKLESSFARHQIAAKKLKQCRAKITCLKNKVENLKDILSDLKARGHLSEDSAIELDALPNISLEILKNASLNATRTHGRSYSDSVKQFATSLYFYSPKAYEFAREKLFLPHYTTLHRWFSVVDGKAGFSEEVFAVLKNVCREKRQPCVLIMDEMSIRKQVYFDGKTQVGYVDFGNGPNVENSALASEVLVFFIVSLSSSWKTPISYFLSAGISSAQKTAFVKMALEKLYAVGVDILAVTCDGLRSNFSMFGQLGAVITASEIRPTFPHPSNDEIKVAAVFDACHMIKIIRNLLAELGIILDENSERVHWNLIKKLFDTQEDQLLTAATKLKRNHIEFYRQKMKVKLAAQTFSSSVSDALKFLWTIKYPGFEDALPTARFVRIVDRLFDLLNSRNPFGKGYKAPLRPATQHVWLDYFQESSKYLLGLQTTEGKKISESKRNTCILGFCTTIASITQLAEYVFDNEMLKYLLTFKLSQDHLELFFGLVRSKGGFNNNPNVLQFRSAYRQIIISRLENMNKTGNSQPQTILKMLHLRKIEVDDKLDTDIVHVSQSRRLSIDEGIASVQNVYMDHSYSESHLGDPVHLTQYVENAIVYIAGYVVRKLLPKVCCVTCKGALVDTDMKQINPAQLQLFFVKDRGGLNRPSWSVYRICTTSEKIIRTKEFGLGYKPIPNMTLRLTILVQRELLGSKVFSELNDHVSDTEIESALDNHVSILTKLVIEAYAKIRFHHAARQITQRAKGQNVRSSLTKLILQKNQ